jgi:hypothetical protein
MIVPGCNPTEQQCKLDRLAGLEKLISQELIDDVIAASTNRRRYKCKLSDDVMIRVVISMGLFTDKPIRQVYRACRRNEIGCKTPARSSLCKARQRLGSEPLRLLHQRVVRPLATPQTPGGFYRGWRLVSAVSNAQTSKNMKNAGHKKEQSDK